MRYNLFKHVQAAFDATVPTGAGSDAAKSRFVGERDASCKTNSVEIGPCTTCSLRSTCTTPCEKLHTLLPSMSAGLHKDIVYNTEMLAYIQPVERVRDPVTLYLYFQAWLTLSVKQREAVLLVHGRGLSQRDAAAATQEPTTASSINGRLKRAKERMEEFLASSHSDDPSRN